MGDQDPFDRVLRDSLGGGVPALSPEFDRRLARRLRPRRVSAAGRVLLALYGVAALVLSVVVMRAEAVAWPAIAAAVGVATLGLAALRPPRRRAIP